jgi:hypothetical protein
VPYTPNLAKNPAKGGIPAKEKRFKLNKIKKERPVLIFFDPDVN